MSRRWLERELSRTFDGKTIVISHHGAHPMSVHPCWVGPATLALNTRRRTTAARFLRTASAPAPTGWCSSAKLPRPPRSPDGSQLLTRWIELPGAGEPRRTGFSPASERPSSRGASERWCRRAAGRTRIQRTVRRSECVPYLFGSSPMQALQALPMRLYWRRDKWLDAARPGRRGSCSIAGHDVRPKP